MVSNTHVLIVILLLYVSLLNVLLVRVMYQKYVHPQLLATAQHSAGLEHKHALANASIVVRRDDACAGVRAGAPVIAITFADADRASGASAPFHDDRMRLLKQVSKAVHGLKQGELRVVLMVTVDAFASNLRTWCADTSVSLGCKLYVLDNALAYTVAGKLLHIAPCDNDFVLLPSSVQVDVHFLPRLARTAPGTVTCLTAVRTHEAECPVPAFRAPKTLLQVVSAGHRHTWQAAAHALGNGTSRQVVAPNLLMAGR